VSIDVSIVGSSTSELEDMVRSGGIHFASVAVTDLLRLAQPGSTPPRAIVLDMRDRTSLPPAVALFKKEHPSTGFVIVADKLDPALMLEAMRAGVNEWVTEPVKASDLLAAMERVAGPVAAGAVGKLFAVIGAKGGVGTTTLAVNIATSLSSSGKASTLLIDAHPAGGDAALFLGADPRFSLIDALENTHRLDEAFLKGIVVKTAAGPDLLAAPEHGGRATIDPRRLRAVVEFAMRRYRFVVLDVPRSDSSIDDTLGLASRITVVATQELGAIRSGGRTAATLRQRYGAEHVQVVVNRYDRSADIASEDVERAVGRIGHTFPSNYRLAIEALNKGRPLAVDNHNKLASSMIAYARSLAGAAKDDAPVEKPLGLLGKLTARR